MYLRWVDFIQILLHNLYPYTYEKAFASGRRIALVYQQCTKGNKKTGKNGKRVVPVDKVLQSILGAKIFEKNSYDPC
jgi:hypothetical protein